MPSKALTHHRVATRAEDIRHTEDGARVLLRGVATAEHALGDLTRRERRCRDSVEGASLHPNQGQFSRVLGDGGAP
eukprot:CAMPEP_0180109972 /NCGR_PEP_ID=MMETSP0985-20121206/34778_1 /TAXON_ID=483367 /ORGANISM="non described non described, Strain CCMP 2436" /LENGTH=75 /DNA_ID=CAMNT_0022047933 /DNA_START=275 /DNA_END=499 /DNA_ORIENTATION=+